MKNAIGYAVVVLLFCAVIYGVYWVAKSVSYEIFYEDMVQDTVCEMVTAEYLNQNGKELCK